MIPGHGSLPGLPPLAMIPVFLLRLISDVLVARTRCRPVDDPTRRTSVARWFRCLVVDPTPCVGRPPALRPPCTGPALVPEHAQDVVRFDEPPSSLSGSTVLPALWVLALGLSTPWDALFGRDDTFRFPWFLAELMVPSVRDDGGSCGFAIEQLGDPRQPSRSPWSWWSHAGSCDDVAASTAPPRRASANAGRKSGVVLAVGIFRPCWGRPSRIRGRNPRPCLGDALAVQTVRRPVARHGDAFDDVTELHGPLTSVKWDRDGSHSAARQPHGATIAAEQLGAVVARTSARDGLILVTPSPLGVS